MTVTSWRKLWVLWTGRGLAFHNLHATDSWPPYSRNWSNVFDMVENRGVTFWSYQWCITRPYTKRFIFKLVVKRRLIDQTLLYNDSVWCFLPTRCCITKSTQSTDPTDGQTQDGRRNRCMCVLICQTKNFNGAINRLPLLR